MLIWLLRSQGAVMYCRHPRLCSWLVVSFLLGNSLVLAEDGQGCSTEAAVCDAQPQVGPWAHRCNVERLDLSISSLTRLPVATRPYVVRLPPGHNAHLAARLGRDALLEAMGNESCTPSQAGSTRKGITEMTLREYIEEWVPRRLHRDPSENRYVFGEFGEQWQPLRDAYVRPPCSTCHGDGAAITIGIGGLHSGAPWHFHNGAFVEVLHGAKHFVLLPPGDEVIPDINRDIQDISQFHWHWEQRPPLEEAGRLARMQDSCRLRATKPISKTDAAK